MSSNWIIGATSNTHPSIMIRHSDNTTSNAVSIDTALISPIHVYNITVSNEVRVQPGDVLMINSTGTNMYYQQHNGPFNYILGTNSALTMIDSNDYPLISAIIMSTTPLMISTVSMTTSSYSKSASEIISKSTITTTTIITQTSYHTISSSSSTLTIQPTVTNVPIPPTSIGHASNIPIPPTSIVPSSPTSNVPNPPPTSTVPIPPTTNIPNPPSIPPTSNIPPSSDIMSYLSSITPTMSFSSNQLMASLTISESSSITTRSTTTTHMKGSTVTTVHTNPITSALQTTEAIGGTTMIHSSSNNSESLTTVITNRTSSIPVTSSSSYALYLGSTVVTKESMEYTHFSGTSITASMESTPDQSTGSNTPIIIAGTISTVFILLVVTILVILIVSVLVCRRNQFNKNSTCYANSDSERIANEQKQDERQNVISNLSANAAYGVIGGNENDVSINPAYGINTIMTQSINEELLVYDEPRAMMYNEQQVLVMPAHNEAYTQQKEEELYI